jgi:hypothetical protein
MDPSAMYLQQLLGSKLPPALRDKENEVMGIEPESLQFTFRVSATFTMQP